MKGDLIIKDIDMEQLEDDLKMLEYVHEDFRDGEARHGTPVDKAGLRVLGMLKTWAEGRKAEREDEEFAEELTTTELLLNAVENRTEVKAAVLYVLKAQRKRLGK